MEQSETVGVPQLFSVLSYFPQFFVTLMSPLNPEILVLKLLRAQLCLKL